MKPARNDKVPPLIVRFTYISVEQDVMDATRNIPRQDKVYFSDQLTSTNGKLFYQARHLAKNNSIFRTWTRLGKVFIKLAESSKPIWVKSLKDLPVM